MANVFENPEAYAATVLPILRREIKGAGLFVHRFGIADYSGSLGDVINVKRPPILRARDAGFRSRNTPLVVDDIIQSKIQVALSKHPYSRVGLSPEEATLDEVSYTRDVQIPQVRAIAEDFDESIAGALAGASFVHEVTFDPAANDWTADARKVARRAKRLLDSSYVPSTGRYWLVGAAVSEAIANTDNLLDVDTSGLPEALRDGVVGRLSGFTIIDWPTLDDDESYFVHNTAVAISAVAPVVPNGAKGLSLAAQGLAVTQVWSYGDDTMEDRSTVHAFTGATAVEDPQTDSNGRIKVNSVSGDVEFEFVRAVRVNFTGDDESSSSSSSSSSN